MVISLPDGPPETIQPGEPTSMTVLITALGESVVADSGTCFFRFGEGSFSAEPLTPLGGDLYEAVLPAAVCGASVEFYFSAQLSGGSEFTNPPAAPAMTYRTTVADGLEVVLDEHFEGDVSGWTIVSDPSLTSGEVIGRAAGRGRG